MLLSFGLFLLDIGTVADYRISKAVQFGSKLSTIIRNQSGSESKKSCSFHSLSHEGTLEFNSLKNDISWPPTPPLPSSFSLDDSSDPAHSTFTVLPRAGGGSWHVGDQLEVLIKISDFQGHAKKYGGDFLLSRLHSPDLKAGVAGQVLDHHNGSYTALIPLLWEGSAEIEVTLVHPSEAITVLNRLTEEQPDRIYFQSSFRSGSDYKTTICNLCLDASKNELCNYTDPRTGEPWFCYKPKERSCDARATHDKGGFAQNVQPTEEKLFQSGVNLKISIPPLTSNNITILPKQKVENESTLKFRPSGYFYQDIWQSLEGVTVRPFSSSSAVTQCVKGKALYLYGDSTVRQWFEYLRDTLPDLKEFDLGSSKQSGPLMAFDYVNNIMVTYHCHGPPIRFGVPISQLRYIANELDGLQGGPNTIVVIGIWAHFSTFPVEVYFRRLLNIRKAVLRLLLRAPETRIFIRTANLKALTLYETLTNSDWFSLQRDKVLRAVFKGVDVQLVDAWAMMLAHHLPHNLHPEHSLIKHMINVLLSHICT